MTKFYQWFDRQKEPYRFLFFLFVLMLPVLTALELGIHYGNVWVSFVAVMCMGFLALSRIWYLNRPRK